MVGVDVGTSGVRAICADASGRTLSAASVALTSDSRPGAGAHEQDPREWWEAVCRVAGQAFRSLPAGGPSVVVGVAVTSTSGSLVATDENGEPLRPAILYDDARAASVAQRISESASSERGKWNSSYSLAKACWLRETEPDIWRGVRHLLHPADWLTGKLSGQFGISDYSNALKLGYEPEPAAWDSDVARLGIPAELLPIIVSPGSQVGHLTSVASLETGLPRGTPVYAAATDGMASLIASGAHEPGDSNTTLGTTIVWKALSSSKPRAGIGIYCHRHPTGLWAPGAASNTGPDVLRVNGTRNSIEQMDQLAQAYLPSPALGYFLPGAGERFPFLNPKATSFCDSFTQDVISDPAVLHAAKLQSLGFVERWGYEVLGACGVTLGSRVYSSGGAATSAIFSRLRAAILQKTICCCEEPSAAFGAAILAARESVYGGDLQAAIAAMTKVSANYEPERHSEKCYSDLYSRFREACRDRGYA